MLRKIYYRLSPGLRLFVRRCYFLPTDIIQGRRKKGSLVPPRGLIFTGSGDYLETGRKYLGYFITLGGLQPQHYVLDVGCGIGRMAVPLTGYLNASACYDGFDIVTQGVRWCQKQISKSFPNFRFRHVDLANDLYTASGKDPHLFVFPYRNGTYDFTIVISVFTHMVRDAMENYLREINRTLGDEGVLFATFFLLNTVSREKMQRSAFKFDYPAEGCYLMDPDVTSANVAYDESDLLALLRRTGFTVKNQFYGTWSGRNDGTLDFQDILILRKTEAI